MPPAAQTISGVLRDALARAADDPHGSDRLHIFSLALPADLDPLSLWALSPDDWAGCWETVDERWAGLGTTLSVSSAGGDATLERVEEAVRFDENAGPNAEVPVRLFGGLPFQPDEEDDDWGRLPTQGFVLPRWSASSRSGRGNLQLALPDRPHAAKHESILEELTLVEAALREVGKATDSGARALDHVGGDDHAGGDGRVAWDAGIRAALRDIERGELQKVVLSRRLDIGLDGRVTGQVLLRRLREEGSGRFRFGLRDGQASFVGASPECLFEKRGHRVAVEALAGTFDLGLNPDSEDLVRAAEHLFASGKDLGEHALVVRGIVEALRPLSASVDAGRWPDVRAAGSLAHLSTAITADLRDGVSAFDLIEALHPTPAVGGLPRDAALRFIRQHEMASRGLYAAPIGWLEPGGDACLAVGIRSALLEPGRARVFAGAGIVAASDPAAEWDETGAKMRWLGELLGGGP